MTRVLIVDDHAVVRRGLSEILTEEFPAAEVGEAQSADAALTLLRNSAWDLVILDISMPGRSGLEALVELRQQWPALPVLVLSMHAEDELAIRVLKAGASGYLTKGSAPEELVLAVHTLLDGGRYVSRRLVERLIRDLQEPGKEPAHATLSDREYEVLCMIAAGKTVTEIARALYLSVKTVSTYRTRILEKLNMRSNAELIAYAVRHGLVI